MKRQIPFLLVFLFALFNVIQYFVPHGSFEFLYEFFLDWIYIIGIFALALGIWSLFRVSVDRISSRRPNWGYNYLTLVGLFLMISFGFVGQEPGATSWGTYWLWLVIFTLLLLALIQVAAINDTGRKRTYAAVALGLLAVAILLPSLDGNWGFFFYTQQGLTNPMFRHFFDYVMMPILATMFALLAFFIASAAYRAFRARNLMATLLLLAALIVMLRFNPYLPFAAETGFYSKLSNWLMNVPNLAAQRAILIGIGLGIVSTSIKVMLGIERGYMGRG